MPRQSEFATGVSSFIQGLYNEMGRRRQNYLQDQQLDMERQRLALEQSRIQNAIDMATRTMAMEEGRYARENEPGYISPMDSRQSDLGVQGPPRQISAFEAGQEIPLVYADIASKGQLSEEEMARLRLGFDQGRAERDDFRDRLAMLQYVVDTLGGDRLSPGQLFELGVNPLTEQFEPTRAQDAIDVYRRVGDSDMRNRLPYLLETVNMAGDMLGWDEGRRRQMIQANLPTDMSEADIPMMRSAGLLSDADLANQRWVQGPVGPMGPQATDAQLQSQRGSAYAGNPAMQEQHMVSLVDKIQQAAMDNQARMGAARLQQLMEEKRKAGPAQLSMPRRY